MKPENMLSKIQRKKAAKWTIDLATFSDDERDVEALRSINIKAQSLYRAGKIDAHATLTRADFGTRKQSKTKHEMFREYLKEQIADGVSIKDIIKRLQSDRE